MKPSTGIRISLVEIRKGLVLAYSFNRQSKVGETPDGNKS